MSNGQGAAAGVVACSFGDENLRNAWHYLATVVDQTSGLLRCYTDGELHNTIALPTPRSFSSTLPLELGRSEVAPFLGALDEVRIDGVAWTPARVAADYDNLGAPGFVVLGPSETRP